MQRNAEEFLLDVQQAADAIADFIQKIDKDTYIANDLVRSAVERKFEIVGEALNQLSKIAPEVAMRVPKLGGVIGFRNMIAHAYPIIDHEKVYRTAREDLPKLRAIVTDLLAELDKSQ